MITQEHLKTVLSYNKDTGLFYWKRHPLGDLASPSQQKRWASAFIGKKAGCLKNTGYIVIRIAGKYYQAHRLAWLYIYGKHPENEIDHIDGNKANNAIANLRDVNNKTNLRNASLSKRNQSGVCGVFWHKSNKKWFAQIGYNNQVIKLGFFDDFFEAVCVRRSKQNELGFHKNHGKPSLRPKNNTNTTQTRIN